MSRPFFRLGFLALVLSVCGCLPSDTTTVKETAPGETPTTPATPRQILERIKQLAADPDAAGNAPERHILTQLLSQMGPTTLAPLIEEMGAPDTAPKTRLFLLQCLADHMTPTYVPSLKPLIESKDEVIRAIGVMAVAHIKDPSVVELLRAARKDPSSHVAFSALSGLAMQGDADARQELYAMYNGNATMKEISIEDTKREIVRVLLRDATKDDLPILQDALNLPYLSINSRFMIAETLGRIGDKSAIPLLEKSLDLQKEPEYGEMVKQAVADITAREDKA